MAETTRNSALLTRDLPLVRVKMTSRGPHVLAVDEQPQIEAVVHEQPQIEAVVHDGQEEPQLFARAAVDAPLPTRANRDILPMATGVPILPTQSAQITGHTPITGCPQTRIYKIGRFIISNAGTAGGAADWVVKDIRIRDVSQFVQSGDVPGAVFAANAENAANEIDKFVRFAPVQIAMDAVVVVVTYIGLNKMGCPFFGGLAGTVVDTGAAKI
jgi:hypothetical protein